MTRSQGPPVSLCLVVPLLLAATLLGCNGDKTVRFGAVLPLSGSVATYGEAVQRGVEIAFEQAQQNPEIQHQLELMVRDSEADPDLAARQLAELYEAGALAAVGGVTSPEALRMVEVAEAQDRILISPSASSPELTGVSRNFIRVFPSDFVEGTKMGGFAANTIKVDDAVIFAAESQYGRGIQGVFKNEFERHGGEILEVLEYPATTSDFSGFIGRVMTLSPDAVYVAAYWDDIVAIITGLREADYQGKILTTAAFATPRAVADAGEAAEGVYFTQTVFDLVNAEGHVRQFLETYRSRYGEDPDLYAAHGYDAMLILTEALKSGGPLPSSFWKGIRSIRSFPGATGSLQFDEKGDVQKYPRVYLISEGVPINYDQYAQDLRQAFQQRLRELDQQRTRLRTNPN